MNGPNPEKKSLERKELMGNDILMGMDGEDESKDRQFVTALARGLEILRCFKPGDHLLGNQDIARRTGLPKPTVSRLTYTLTRLGYLTYSESLGKYQLGTAVLSLGYSLLTNMGLLKVARPAMQELADYSQAAVSLGARDRLNMVYLETCRSNTTAFTLRLEVGSRIPLATTAMGRAFLCGLAESERDYLLDQIRRHNEVEWPKIQKGLEQAFRDFEERGFCLSHGEWRQEVNAVAVPMKSVAGSGPLAFNCGGPSFLLRRHMLEDDLGPRLVSMVRNLEAEATQF